MKPLLGQSHHKLSGNILTDTTRDMLTPYVSVNPIKLTRFFNMLGQLNKPHAKQCCIMPYGKINSNGTKASTEEELCNF